MARTIERKAYGEVAVPELLQGTSFLEEAGADTFRITDLPLTPVSGSGGVLAHVLRADDTAIAVDGTVDSEGAAVVTLDADCYHVAGRLSVAIYVTDAQQNSVCVYACVGNVYRTKGSTELDSGTTVPTLAQLEAAYAACISATQQAATCVSYEAQTLTDTQQAQARANIFAPAETAVLLAKPSQAGRLVTYGETVDITDVVTGGNYKYEVEDCSPGDVFWCAGSTTYYQSSGWLTFIASDGTVLWDEPTHKDTFRIATAPANTAKVIRQYSTSAAASKNNTWYKGVPAAQWLPLLEARVAALEAATVAASAAETAGFLGIE